MTEQTAIVPHPGGRWQQSLAPGGAAAVPVATLSPQPVPVTGFLMAALVVATTVAARRVAMAPAHSGP